MTVLEVSSGLGVFLVIDLFGQFLAGASVKTYEAESSVEKHRAACHRIDRVVFDQDASVDGPDGFNLLPRAVAAFGGGREKAPDERTIGGS